MNKETLLNIVLVVATVVIVYLILRFAMKKGGSTSSSSGTGRSISDYLYVFPTHPKSAPMDHKCKDKDSSGKCEPTFVDASGQGWCLDSSKDMVTGCPCYYYQCSVKPADQTPKPVPSPAKPTGPSIYSRTYPSISSSLSSMASGGTMSK